MNQLYIFLNFVLTGIVIGILYDIFRILRKSFKTIDIITYIQDFIFWIFTGIVLLYSIFTFNNGELRSYVFIGIIIGIILYMLLLSKYFVKISVYVIRIIKKLLYWPLSKLYHIIKKYIFRPIYNKIAKISFKLPKINLKKKKTDNLSNKI